MRRLSALSTTVSMFALLVSAAACASTPSGTSPTRPATQTMGSADVGTITINTAPTADVTKLGANVDAVWRIMPSIMDSVGIAVGTMDQASHTIGTQGFKLRGRLGKVSLSRIIDCGTSTQIGPNADTYEVYLTVLSTVKPDGTAGASISTIVEARARPINFNQGYSNCPSKGTLEIRIADLVKARLAK